MMITARATVAQALTGVLGFDRTGQRARREPRIAWQSDGTKPEGGRRGFLLHHCCSGPYRLGGEPRTTGKPSLRTFGLCALRQKKPSLFSATGRIQRRAVLARNALRARSRGRAPMGGGLGSGQPHILCVQTDFGLGRGAYSLQTRKLGARPRFGRACLSPGSHGCLSRYAGHGGASADPL